MAIVALLLGAFAIFAVLTYYLVLLMLAALAIAGLVIIGISAAVAQAYGTGTGVMTGLALSAGLIALYRYWVRCQDEAAARERAEEVERLLTEAQWRAVEAERRRETAVARPWHDRSAQDWLRIWFS